MNFLPPVPGSGDAGEVERPEYELLQYNLDILALDRYHAAANDIRRITRALNHLNLRIILYNAYMEASSANRNDPTTNISTRILTQMRENLRERNNDPRNIAGSSRINRERRREHNDDPTNIAGSSGINRERRREHNDDPRNIAGSSRINRNETPGCSHW